MSRTRKSAKAAGSTFERQIADCLRDALCDPNIQRAPLWGAVDKGDIVNVRIDGHDLVIQTKNVTKLDLPKGVGDAKVQAVNAEALAGLFIHKRHGKGDPMDQWVSCTVAELVALITKVPVHARTAEGIEGRRD
ncbi:holliday junction resolvase [Mycobacterium phage Aziz]|uniref:Holliday junction resolvase n=2 Tax=Reyvirus TaxID=1623301 RepID=A0A7G9A2F0_9CAUD|nr:holliday junction resolvase [Mycobacterium phage Aziz]YP_010013835.1 holliday junction resolvase [Mycobacterium phage Estes]ASR75925.1 holliday junction resolvase [Mycobacterium phage GenevaB15]QNJ56738.1 holliday junction resolvase [Mycobacterium phage Aziz]QNL30789.1 holliday junction resolvase [Mycobacterium phage Estes]